MVDYELPKLSTNGEDPDKKIQEIVDYMARLTERLEFILMSLNSESK